MKPATKPRCDCAFDLDGSPGDTKRCRRCGQLWRAYPGERVRCVWDRVAELEVVR